MRKAIITAFFLLSLSAFAFGQMIEIQSMNGNEICRGYGLENHAYVAITSSMPFPPPPNTVVVYTWTAEHPNGNKIWNTANSYRAVPIPWVGNYIVRVKVEYIRRGKSRPFAAFISSPINIIGRECGS